MRQPDRREPPAPEAPPAPPEAPPVPPPPVMPLELLLLRRCCCPSPPVMPLELLLLAALLLLVVPPVIHRAAAAGGAAAAGPTRHPRAAAAGDAAAASVIPHAAGAQVAAAALLLSSAAASAQVAAAAARSARADAAGAHHAAVRRPCRPCRVELPWPPIIAAGGRPCRPCRSSCSVIPLELAAGVAERALVAAAGLAAGDGVDLGRGADAAFDARLVLAQTTPMQAWCITMGSVGGVCGMNASSRRATMQPRSPFTSPGCTGCATHASELTPTPVTTLTTKGALRSLLRTRTIEPTRPALARRRDGAGVLLLHAAAGRADRRWPCPAPSRTRRSCVMMTVTSVGGRAPARAHRQHAEHAPARSRHGSSDRGGDASVKPRARGARACEATRGVPGAHRRRDHAGTIDAARPDQPGSNDFARRRSTSARLLSRSSTFVEASEGAGDLVQRGAMIGVPREQARAGATGSSPAAEAAAGGTCRRAGRPHRARSDRCSWRGGTGPPPPSTAPPSRTESRAASTSASARARGVAAAWARSRAARTSAPSAPRRPLAGHNRTSRKPRKSTAAPARTVCCHPMESPSTP